MSKRKKQVNREQSTLAALSLPEEVERNLTERERGFYLCARVIAAGAVATFNNGDAPKLWADGVVIACKCAIDNMDLLHELKARHE